MKGSVRRMPGLPGPEPWFAVGMVLLAGVCWAVALLCRTRLGLPFEPYGSPLFNEHFPDILLFRERFHFFHSASFFTYPFPYHVMYPAPVAVVYKILYVAGGSHPVRLFIAFVLGVYGIAGALFARGLAQRGVEPRQAVLFTAATLSSCYPIWFDLKQANMEIVVWGLVAGGVALLLAEHDLLASLCFCLAASMKIYPAVFLCVLLLRKRYRDILVGLGVAALAQVCSLWLECPSIRFASQQTKANLDLFRQFIMLHLVPQAEMDHSLFCLFKRTLRPLPGPQRLGHMLTVYLAVTALVSCVLLFGVLRKLPLANQILGLTILCVLLPPTSFEYTLQHMLIPTALLLLLDAEARMQGGRLRGLQPVLLCMLVLLGAIPEVIRKGIRLDGSIKAVTLMLLLGICLRTPFVVERHGTLPEPYAAG